MRVANWLPTGRSGAWEVRRKAGAPDVTELVEHVDGGELLWMDDADTELAAHREILAASRGDVLLLGLGIGFLPAMLATREDVTSITIVEKSFDVMSLVWGRLGNHVRERGKEIRCIWADAETWQPGGERYDVAWIDHVLEPIQGERRETWLAKARGWADVVLAWRGAI